MAIPKKNRELVVIFGLMLNTIVWFILIFMPAKDRRTDTMRSDSQSSARVA